MQILLVYAHPEPQSFNGALLDAARQEFEQAGHSLEVSDLYSMGFDPVADRHDVTQRDNAEVFNLGAEQMHASRTDGFAPDLQSEIDKLMRADLLILQFPMWWFSMPAILKGWVDRVFAFGKAYDFGRTWENGVFAGRRAMLTITASAPAAAFFPDGRNGDMERVLWPIHGGLLALCGYQVLPPFIAHGIPFVGEEAMQTEIQRYREHLSAVDQAEPLYFHPASDIDKYRLKPEVEPATPAQHRGARRHLPDEG